MRATLTYLVLLAAIGLLVMGAAPQEARPPVSLVSLDPSTKLELRNAAVRFEEHLGRKALKLLPLPGHEQAVNEEMVAVLPDLELEDGTIEVNVAGSRRAGYATLEDVRGFKGVIGVAFRVREARSEVIYLRPENARLDDQLFRNRATQYESPPDHPWNRLREEHPGLYESYVDLEPGQWTHMRIEVTGAKARLYVNGAAQPCLVVNDLKQAAGKGRIALYARVSTDAWFSGLRVERRK